jgi:hypothetical protein
MPFPKPPTRRRRTAHALATLGILLGACDSSGSGSQERACHDAVRAGRLDVKAGRLEDARARLEAARGKCTERQAPYVDQLQDEIARAEAQERAAAARKVAEAERTRQEPLVPFMDWVRTRTTTGAAPGADARCRDRTDAEFGWCEETREVVEGVPFHARYRETEPRSVRFYVTVPTPVVCDDLGMHRVVRSWTVTREGGPDTRRVHCELQSKLYRGFAALISVTGTQSEVEVFNQGYLSHDATFAATLRREGR